MFDAGLRGFKLQTLRAVIYGISIGAIVSCGVEPTDGDDGSSSSTESSTHNSSSSPGSSLPLSVNADAFARFHDATDAQLGDCGDSEVPVDLVSTEVREGCDVAMTEDGEWLEYDINMPTAGTFALNLIAGAVSEGAKITVLVDGSEAGTLDIPVSQTLQNASIDHVAFNSGASTVRLEFSGDLKFAGFDIGDAASPSELVIAIRVGDEGFSDGEFDYMPDSNLTHAGTIQDTPDPVSGTDYPELYQRERYGTFSYEIPVDNGQYDITLKMVEMYWNAESRRVFNVLAEGEPIVSALDLFYLVGHDAAFDLTASGIKVEDGALSLDFYADKNYATLSALVVTQTATSSSESSSSSSVESSSSEMSSSSSSSSEESSASSESSADEESSSSSEASSSSSVESSTSSEESSTSSEESSSSEESTSSVPSSSSSSEVSSSSSQSSVPVDSDGDGVIDADDAFPQDPEETLDTDGDGIGDNADVFPADPLESQDGDGDGVGDNADQCTETAADEEVNEDGCSENDLFVDSDEDGVADDEDWAPNDPTETKDTDGDGVGDNADAFPNDESETADSDSDGVGDNADQCSATAAGETVNDAGCSENDLFVDSDDDGVADEDDWAPNDPTESADTDGDGVGDNSDVFPEDATETVDSDNDGVGDNSDVFPNDATESADTDSDGVGDNADAFPNDATETTDSDSDGVGDSSDAFPNDAAESADTDGDGVGDNADQCASTPANQSANSQGCSAEQLFVDTDGDSIDEANGTDKCLGTAAGARVDSNGCSADQLTGNEADGANIWASSCAGCHGSYINDGVVAAYNVDPSNLQKTTDETLASYIEAEMPLTDKDACVEQCAADVAAYTRKLQAVPDADGDGIFDADDLCSDTPSGEAAGADGCSASQIDAEALYSQTCAGCHGAEGEGGNFPAVWGASAADLRDAIESNATMAAVAGDLTDVEIEALGNVMSQFPEPEPAPLGDVENGKTQFDAMCSSCHGAIPINMTDFEELHAKIDETMPTSDPTLCAGDCAKDVAAYLAQ